MVFVFSLSFLCHSHLNTTNICRNCCFLCVTWFCSILCDKQILNTRLNSWFKLWHHWNLEWRSKQCYFKLMNHFHKLNHALCLFLFFCSLSSKHVICIIKKQTIMLKIIEKNHLGSSLRLTNSLILFAFRAKTVFTLVTAAIIVAGESL